MESHNQLVRLRGGMNCLAGPGFTICTLLGTSETGFADKSLWQGALYSRAIEGQNCLFY